MSSREILLGLTGRKPSKIKPECASEESFLGDALSERDRDRTGMKALSRACPVADPVGDPEGTRREYNRREPSAMRPRFRSPLGSGPEGVTLEGRKTAMAGTGGAVNERGSMPTLLNDTNFLVFLTLKNVKEMPRLWNRNNSH